MTRIRESKKRDLTKGPILRQVILFALPLIATGIMGALFNTVDTVMVGRWGGETPQEREIALAAVGSCGSLTNLLLGLFMDIATGASVCVAQALGRKDYDGVSEYVHTAVFSSIFGGVAAGACGFFFAEPLLRLMGSPEAVLPAATLYMKACFCGAPALVIYNFCAAILRAEGDTTRPCPMCEF